MSTYLFIALSTKGYGETFLGLHVARRLAADAHRPVFLAHDSAAPVLKDGPFPYALIGSHMGPLIEFYLDRMVTEHRPGAVVLSDLFTTDLWFQHHDGGPELLDRYGLPVLAIDTWAFAESGPAIDVFHGHVREYGAWRDRLHGLLTPTPIVSPSRAGGAYSTLPPHPCRSAPGAGLRRKLGVGSGTKLVLFCTALWQQTQYQCEHAERLAVSVPELIEQYLSGLESDVHLVHVGPRRYAFRDGERYHWLPQLSPAEFDSVLADVDLLLTANVSSTTIGKAMVTRIPTMVVVNSFRIDSSDDRLLPFAVTDRVHSWLDHAAPIFPFFLWPVGYHAFLSPVLEDNPYRDALLLAELLDQQTFQDTLRGALAPGPARDAHLHAQSVYLSRVRALPPVEILVQEQLSGLVPS